MAVDEKARQALNLASLSLPASIKVTRLEVEDYTDWSGDPALRVLAVLDESVDVTKVGGKAVGELKHAIHTSLIQHGVTVFPYIFLAKQSELDDTDED